MERRTKSEKKAGGVGLERCECIVVQQRLADRRRTLVADVAPVKAGQWKIEWVMTTDMDYRDGRGSRATHSSDLSVLFRASASPIAAAPVSPILLPRRLHSERKGIKCRE
jgi:hypothetical protein